MADVPRTFGSLFAGIGGIDLGLERSGLECKWQVEIEPYCQKVLKRHWPGVPLHDDVTTFPPDDWTQDTLQVDLVAGGFPCTDLSTAGKGEGLHGPKSGLFFDIIRIAGILRPRWLLLENVAALITRGLPEVLIALAGAGYDAKWQVLSAQDVGAPHRRRRIFIQGELADADYGHERSEETICPGGHAAISCSETLADADRTRELQPRRDVGQKRRWPGDGCEEGTSAVRTDDGWFCRTCGVAIGNGCGCPHGEWQCVDCGEWTYPFHYEHADGCQFCGSRLVSDPYCLPGTQRGDHPGMGRQGQSISQRWPTRGRDHWVSEPNVGRVADGIPRRVDRLRGIGNAVVPQCIEELCRQWGWSS